MRTRELRNDAGQLTGFEISNLLITRGGVERVVKRVPGVSITKSTRAWRWSAEDDFVHFVLNGHVFFAIEPFGDNDCYWIVAEDAKDIPEIGAVKGAFERHRVWGLI
jgi:hypothetical protein